ncbi:hypothetical protein OQJ26_16100 [Legionella sp. PATHC038]|uniref:scabin-related ADP-ribosyltransferase n=1 Tax=Legionella sheltonii TaxID=2992041 RepID=UPI00224337C7|nr:hypothetical protein [Legionella sp. PATHC038]MCW8400304.1 hypothetical protein [Legionella sp. PATHC038]
MIDSNKFQRLYRIIDLLIASDSAPSFWKGTIPSWKGTIPRTQNLPATVFSMRELFEEHQSSPFKSDFSEQLRLLINLGKKADDALNAEENSVKEKLSTFKMFKSLSRDPITQDFYEAIAQLKDLDNLPENEQNILINEVKNKLLDIIQERKSVHYKSPRLMTDILHEEQQERLLKSQLKLHAAEDRTITYIYSDIPPSQVFRQGFKSNGLDRVLFDGVLGRSVDKESSMYLISQNHLDLKKAQKHKYVYVVDVFSSAIINTNDFSRNPVPNLSLIPRAVEPGEVVGCFQVTSGERPQIVGVEGNKEYKKSIAPGEKLLFRADSRHHSGDPSKDLALNNFKEGSMKPKPSNIFNSGMKPWTKYSDDYEGHIDKRTPTIFISSTDDIERALKFPEEVKANEKRYIYVMYKPERTIKSKDLYANSLHAINDSEYLVPGGISGEHIIGMYTYENGKFTSFDHNPNCTVNIGSSPKDFLEERGLPITEDMENIEEKHSKFEL